MARLKAEKDAKEKVESEKHAREMAKIKAE